MATPPTERIAQRGGAQDLAQVNRELLGATWEIGWSGEDEVEVEDSRSERDRRARAPRPDGNA